MGLWKTTAPHGRTDLKDYIQCYNPDKNLDVRFRKYIINEILDRDQMSLNFGVKISPYSNLENLSGYEVLATDIYQ